MAWGPAAVATAPSAVRVTVVGIDTDCATMRPGWMNVTAVPHGVNSVLSP